MANKREKMTDFSNSRTPVQANKKKLSKKRIIIGGSVLAVLVIGAGASQMSKNDTAIVSTESSVTVSSVAAENVSQNANTYLQYKLQTYQNMKETYAYDEVVEDFQENISGKYEDNAYYSEIKEIYDYCKTHSAKTDFQNKQKDVETSQSIPVSSISDDTSQISIQVQSNVEEKRNFDFILNTSTHTYHLYECSAAKKIKPENRLDVTKTAYSLEEAEKMIEAEGYKLCGRCD